MYEVQDVSRCEPVALKTLSLKNRVTNDAEYLASEFRVLSRLLHPALARVHKFGSLTEGTGPYFTAELIRSVPILEWAKDVSSKWPVAESIAAQLLGALNAIHRADYIHGDLKPDHVLITPANGVKMIDFGGAVLAAHSGGRWTTLDLPTALRPHRRPASVGPLLAGSDTFSCVRGKAAV